MVVPGTRYCFSTPCPGFQVHWVELKVLRQRDDSWEWPGRRRECLVKQGRGQTTGRTKKFRMSFYQFSQDSKRMKNSATSRRGWELLKNTDEWLLENK